MRTFWAIIGVLLLAWVAFDLYAGYTFLHDVIYRDSDPLLYWVSITIWLGLGFSCFFSWSSDDEA